MTKFSDLKEKVLTDIKVEKYNRNLNDGDCIKFTCSDGTRYKMLHYQDCCESVYIEDICGDLELLLHSPILLAEEVSYKDENPPEVRDIPYADDSTTWTFYKLSTINGSVTIRWFGSSNGYYSESVSFQDINDGYYT